MREIQYEIVEHIGTIRHKENGYRMDVNLMSWESAEPKVDIRTWSDQNKPYKGITLTPEEAMALAEMIMERVNF